MPDGILYYMGKESRYLLQEDKWMNSGKQKNFERLKKKRIWPSIVMFIAFAVLCLFVLVMFVQFFATYIVGVKLDQMHEETLRTSQMMEGLMKKGKTVSEAVEEMDSFMTSEEAVFVTDKEQNPVAGSGTSEPDFDTMMMTFLNEDIVAFGDSEVSLIQEEGPDTLFGVSFEKLLEDSFRREGGLEGPWLHETVLETKIWLQSPLKSQDYNLYVRYTLQIQRQDILYVCAFGVLILILLLIPICFLLVNTIRAIVTQRRMAQMLYLDIVTGGRNWLYFENCAARILTRRRNGKKPFAMVVVHLERYHNYCACYGARAGEELLQRIDGFLRARTGRDEVHARYEGADFGLLLCCQGQQEEDYKSYCEKRVRSLLAELPGLRPEQKLHFHAGVYMIDPCIMGAGRRYSGRKNVDIDQMYHYANTARMETKCREERRVAFFDQNMREEQMWNQKVEANMEAALRGEQFQVYLQPKYSPTEGRLVGAEALVRWLSPTEGLIPPKRFIPIFEENGFITQLDDYMISHVAKLQAEWTIQGKKVVPVSVNLSRAHFAQEGLAEHICRLVDAYGPKHELIELEVTESAFFDDKELLTETVKKLKAYGFQVSMDDFGTGYSSLNSLKDIPLDTLKLDTEFFRGNGDAQRGEIIVQEAIRLARNLNMHVVAEGIENREQVDFLAELGCDMIQGFYFAKPMPVAEFEEKVEKDA